MNASNEQNFIASLIRWSGAVGIAAIVVMRMLTAFAPEVYFDIDPATQPSALAALSPAGSLVLDVLLLVACAIALAGERLSGRTLDWKLLGLALLPLPIVLNHGASDLGDLWRGSTWVAGAAALVAVAHLARDRTMRIVLLSLLIAVCGPLLVRGLAQVTFEHTATVSEFERNRDQFLAERGWQEHSPAAQIYERRLRQPQPLGWFATTNIFASVTAAGVVAMIGLGIGALRRGREVALSQLWLFVLGVTIAASLAALVLSGSKGAMLAALLGGLLLALLGWNPKKVEHFAPWLLLGAIVLALIGVMIRGVLLPEGFAGDRSLLFRWHYLASAFDVFRDAPLLGVGPDGFQDAYTQFRLPRNPEEVMSAHSVFVDCLCTLGIAGFAWIALVLVMLIRAGREVARSGESVDSDRAGSNVLRTSRNVAAAVVVLGIVPATVIELHILDQLHMMVRIAGMVAFMMIAATVTVFAERAERAALAVAIAAAITVLLVHGQIEMTFVQPGSVTWAMCLIGLASSSQRDLNRNRRVSQWRGSGLIVILLISAAWIAITGARPALAQQAVIADAATALQPWPESRETQLRQRELAAEKLIKAYEVLPTNPSPLRAASHQLERAAVLLYGNERITTLERAHELADRTVRSHPGATSLSDRIAVTVQLWLATSDASHAEAALRDLKQLAQLDPHGVQPWLEQGHLLWHLGRIQEAIDAYAIALRNNQNFELDPLKQLPARDREAIERRVEAVRE